MYTQILSTTKRRPCLPPPVTMPTTSPNSSFSPELSLARQRPFGTAYSLHATPSQATSFDRLNAMRSQDGTGPSSRNSSFTNVQEASLVTSPCINDLPHKDGLVTALI